MVPAIFISVLTCIILILSVLFFPKIKIKKIEINAYWVIALIGALSLLIFGLVTIK